MTGASGESWLDAASRSDLPVKAVQVGRNGLADTDGRWRNAYGLEPGGAVLVRPDGYVAWRSAATTKEPSRTLGAALAHLQRRA
jgi:putative polyketide hydroxylase